MKLPKDTLIVDPYMGSGPCGVAAVELGYAFAGWEIDETYFNTAARRIRAAQLQMPMVYERTLEPTKVEAAV